MTERHRSARRTARLCGILAGIWLVLGCGELIGIRELREQETVGIGSNGPDGSAGSESTAPRGGPVDPGAPEGPTTPGETAVLGEIAAPPTPVTGSTPMSP